MNETKTPVPVPLIHKKHLGFFWPFVIILAIAAIVAGAVVWMSYNNMLSDDISSMVFRVHRSDVPQATSTDSSVGAE